MTAALGALAADPRVKVVVITGAGDVFSTGFDLAGDLAAETARLAALIARAPREVLLRTKAKIVRLHGDRS